MEEDSGITVSWATSNHATMLNQSLYILGQDNKNGNTPVYVHNLTTSNGYLISDGGKYSSNAQGYIKAGSKAPDTEEIDPSYIRHYYRYGANGSKGITKDINQSDRHADTAYDWFNTHYYWAKCEYAVGNYATAYDQLGRSIHYLEDINAPHHAMLATTSDTNHREYETWVSDHFYSSYWEYGSAGGSYSYMCNSTFLAISNNFSQYACSQYSACNNFQSNESAAKNATASLTKKTQRAVAGLLYRFLVDTGRAN